MQNKIKVQCDLVIHEGPENDEYNDIKVQCDLSGTEELGAEWMGEG